MKLFFCVACICLLFNPVFAQQGVSISNQGQAPDPSAGLDINFNDKGLLIPRVTTAQRNAISNPAEFLMVMNLDTRCFEMYNASGQFWETFYCLCSTPTAVLRDSTTNIAENSIRIQWQSHPNSTYYQLDIASDSLFQNILNGYQLSQTSNTYFDASGLTCNADIYFRIRGMNACGVGQGIFSTIGKSKLGPCSNGYCVEMSSTNSEQHAKAYPLNDGGFIVTGSTASFGNGGWEQYIARVSSSFSIVWERTYGGTSTEYGISSCQTTDGGIAIVGEFNSSPVTTSATSMIVTKWDQNGNLQWNRFLKGISTATSTESLPEAITATNDGGVAIGFRQEGSSFGGFDMGVMKLDANGSLQWSAVVGGSSTDNAYGIASSPVDGSIVLVGYTSSFGAGSNDVYVAKWSSGGSFQWANTYGGSNSDFGYTATIDNSGNIYVGGYSQSFGNGNDIPFIMKLDANGTVLWEKVMTGGSNNSGQFRGLTINPSNEIVATGYTYSFGFGDSDVLICKFDQSGNLLKAKSLGTTGSEIGYNSMTFLPNGEGAVGYMNNNNGRLMISKYDANFNTCCDAIIHPVPVNTTISVASNGSATSIGSGHNSTAGSSSSGGMSVTVNCQ